MHPPSKCEHESSNAPLVNRAAPPSPHAGPASPFPLHHRLLHRPAGPGRRGVRGRGASGCEDDDDDDDARPPNPPTPRDSGGCGIVGLGGRRRAAAAAAAAADREEGGRRQLSGLRPVRRERTVGVHIFSFFRALGVTTFLSRRIPDGPTHPPTHPRIDRFSLCICFSFSPSFPPPLGPDLARDVNAQDPGRHRDGARMVAYQGLPTVPEFRRKGGEVRQGRSGVGRDRLREGLHVPERWRRLLTR